MNDLSRLSIERAAELLANKEISSEQLTRAALERIHGTELELHSFITVTEETALAQAKAADARRAKGETGPLLGIPIGSKDMILTKGIRPSRSRAWQ